MAKKKNLFDYFGDVIKAPIRLAGDISNEYYYGGTEEKNRRRGIEERMAERTMSLKEQQYGLEQGQFGLEGMKADEVQRQNRASNIVKALEDTTPPEFGGRPVEENYKLRQELNGIIKAQRQYQEQQSKQMTGGWSGAMAPQQGSVGTGGALSNMAEPLPEGTEERRQILREPDRELSELETKRLGLRTSGADFSKGYKQFQYESTAGKDRWGVVEKKSADGNVIQKPYQYGTPIEPGFNIVKEAASQFTVNTGDMGQTTKNKVEEEFKEGAKSIGEMKNVLKSYRPEFSQWQFRGKDWLGDVAEKAGMKRPDQETALRTSKEQSAAYTQWYQPAEASFLSFRKWATGVAGGEKEMTQMRQAFPEPRDMSPTDFVAAMEKAIQYKEMYQDILRGYLESGTLIDKNVQSEIAMKVLTEIEGKKQKAPAKSVKDMSLEELTRIAEGK